MKIDLIHRFAFSGTRGIYRALHNNSDAIHFGWDVLEKSPDDDENTKRSWSVWTNMSEDINMPEKTELYGLYAYFVVRSSDFIWPVKSYSTKIAFVNMKSFPFFREILMLDHDHESKSSSSIGLLIILFIKAFEVTRCTCKNLWGFWGKICFILFHINETEKNL